MIQSSNPTLSSEVFRSQHAGANSAVMTVEGAVNKCILAIILTLASAFVVWTWPPIAEFIMATVSSGGFMRLLVFLIAPLAICLTITFKPQLSPVLTPVYAVMEGAILAGITFFFEAMYPGIAFQAVMLTFLTLFAMLLAYKSGVIRATPLFKKVLYCSIGGIFLFYMFHMIAGLFGFHMTFLQEPSPLSIGFSIVVVAVASFSLILDFDFIERAGNSGSAPKYMEWYAAFGLLVTLVWLYVEILRLLALLQDRR